MSVKSLSAYCSLGREGECDREGEGATFKSPNCLTCRERKRDRVREKKKCSSFDGFSQIFYYMSCLQKVRLCKFKSRIIVKHAKQKREYLNEL